MQFASTELAAPTYQPCLQILYLLQILQPACLVGLFYFVLPWPYLGPVWGLSPFWRCLALLVCCWSCPFLSRLALLSSYTVLLPCLCLFACTGWVHCVAVCFACVARLCKFNLPASSACFCCCSCVPLVVLCWAFSCSCYTCACAGAVSTAACTCCPSCAARTLAGLSVSLTSTSLLLALLWQLVLCALLPAPVP